LRYLTIIFIVLLGLILTSCEDKSIITLYDKKVLDEKLPCLRLVVFPPNEMTTNTLQSFYGFDKNCSFTLEVSQKSGITCNSNQNSNKKALSNFPTSYLNMSIRRNSKIVYTYYIDLTHKINKDDLKDGFKKVEKYL